MHNLRSAPVLASALVVIGMAGTVLARQQMTKQAKQEAQQALQATFLNKGLDVMRSSIGPLGALMPMCKRVCVVLLMILASACGGSSTTTSPTPTPTPQPIVGFTIVGGTFTATLNNQTYTAAGSFPVTLSPGAYTITGSFRAQALYVVFLTPSLGGVGGGVVSGSVAGSALSVSDQQKGNCGIAWFDYGATPTSHTFQVQFQVSSNASSTCQGGV